MLGSDLSLAGAATLSGWLTEVAISDRFDGTQRTPGESLQRITADQLRANGLPFMDPPPETYYEMLAERLPGHGEPVDEMKARGLLLDGSTEEGDPRLLLQIFTGNMFGPVFFEIIQRKKDEGFGEGNFKALFESIERDQMQRGKLKGKGEKAEA